MPQIVRLTLFKIGDEALLKEAKSKYSTLAQDAQKVSPRQLVVPQRHPNPAMSQYNGGTCIRCRTAQSRHIS